MTNTWKRKETSRLLSTALAAAALLGAVALAAATTKPKAVPYPEGYRSWTHVKSMVIRPGHPLADPFLGIHHVYANEAAVEGLRTGHYPDGAVLVFDLLEAKDGEKTIEEGKRKLLGVMTRDAEAFAATGGWGFDAFADSSRSERLVHDGGASCFACHKGAKAHGYVFSRLRD